MIVNIDLSNITEVMNKSFWFLLNNQNRFIICRGGAGSGKSYSIIQSLIFRILYDYDDLSIKHHFLLLRKTLPAAKKSLIPLLRYLIKDWGLQDIVVENKTDHIFTFSNGSVISIDSLDDAEKIKSVFGITKIFLEEANEFTSEDFKQLNLRLRGITKSTFQIIIAFNPISKNNWIYRDLFINPLGNAYYHHSTYKDNKFLDKEYIKELEGLIKKDEMFYNIYTLGEWGCIEGLVFPKYNIIDEWPSDIKYHIYGVDFGFTAPTAITRCAIEGDDLFWNEVFYETKKTNQELIEFLKSISIDELYCDTAEPARIKEMRNNGINAKKSIKDIKPGIDYIKRYNINVTRSSTNLIKELDTYKWMDSIDGKNDKDLPVDFMNHAIDSGRYPAYTKWGRKRIFDVVV